MTLSEHICTLHHLVLELIDHFQLGLHLVWLKAHLQVSSRVKHEGSLLCGGIYVVVVLELCQWKQLAPVILPLVDEEVELLLQLLVDPFHLPITLWMVGYSGSVGYHISYCNIYA